MDEGGAGEIEADAEPVAGVGVDAARSPQAAGWRLIAHARSQDAAAPINSATGASTTTSSAEGEARAGSSGGLREMERP